MKVALIYDFDGTLAPWNMQEHGFIDKLGMKGPDFWKEVKEISIEHEADGILVYMMYMLKKASQKEIPLNRKIFADFWKDIEFYPWVLDWFSRINNYGTSKEIEVEHYIISSGNREIIEWTAIAHEFKRIFASTYKYDHNGVPEYPAVAINYTTKTQFLFRISKGTFDLHDSSTINKPAKEHYIPFSQMIFIGDGETDIPCFRLLRDKWGYAIAVYQPNTPKAREKGKELIDDGRVHCAFQADYSQGKNLEITVQAMIDKIFLDNRISNLVKNDLE